MSLSNSLVTNGESRATLSVDGNARHVIPLQWFKLLLRMRQLPDGCHSMTLIKDGDTCQWVVMQSGKVEG